MDLCEDFILSWKKKIKIKTNVMLVKSFPEQSDDLLVKENIGVET